MSHASRQSSHHSRTGGRLFAVLLAAACLVRAGGLRAEDADASRDPSVLKRLSLEELLDMRVTSVSRKPERLSQAASAVQLITSEDIRRSGATNLPEALRLASNLQVAQANASQWAISARGFNNVLANKLLVLVDGRVVYTPLYAGVFWDAQAVPLELVERIEVISGPGGTLWGANAINGVINIITKGAEATQGVHVEGGAGSERRGFAEARAGLRAGEHTHARVYARIFDEGSTLLTDGKDSKDQWAMGLAGFRLDWTPEGKDQFTVQGDLQDARPRPDGKAPVLVLGGNLLARWKHTASENSDFQLQMYADRASRDFNNGFWENLSTYDIDWQHRFRPASRHELIWGAGARFMRDQENNLGLFLFTPGKKTLHLYSAFAQDEIALAERRLTLTVGSKIEHNDYTGYEVDPGVRLAWTRTDREVIWAAASRGVRTPARLDRDFNLYLAPGVQFIKGDSMGPEVMRSVELGWRMQAKSGASISVASFYNAYDDLRSVEPGPAPSHLPVTFGNGVRGHSYGVEIPVSFKPAEWWMLRGGYTFVKKKLELKPGSADMNKASAESDDPENQLLVQSMINAPGHLELDAVLRYVDALPKPSVPSYIGLDARIGWRPAAGVDLSIAGQNLLDKRRSEFKPSSPSPRLIERGVYGKATIEF